jgi:hypothetical protein
MNCTSLDHDVSNINQAIVKDTAIFVTFTTTLTLLSLTLLAYGQFIVRTTSVIVAGLAMTIVAYILTGLIQSLACVVRIVIASISGCSAIVVTMCLLCAGPMLLGGAAFGAAAHYVYTALPLNDIPAPFTLLNESAYYYLSVCAAVVVGCVVACFTKTTLMQVCSSLIGGAGITGVVDVVTLRIGSTPLSPTMFPIVMLSTAFAGVLFQKFMQWRRRKRRHVRYDHHRAQKQQQHAGMHV